MIKEIVGNKKKIFLLLIGMVITLGIVLRGLFLVADPPSDLTISGGLVGDAGQHSYGARNKILFGQWSFDDWKPHVASPLINVFINYPVYKIFGINFYSHRIIPLVFSSLALIFFIFVIYRYLGAFACLVTSILISFNFPLIIYSKAANRYFPMIFFFIVSFYFFVKGASEKKDKFFLFSAVFFICSYLSQNHMLYLISMFFVLGILWVIEKKIRFRHFAIFFGTVLLGLVTWYLLIFLPNREFFGFFIEHNKLVRKIHSMGKLLQNILNNPFMFRFKSDPLLLIFSSLAIMIFIKLRLDKKNKVPFIVDASVFWLLIGVVFFAVWSYHPTRFYLILVFPASILVGWILSVLKENKFKIDSQLSSILSLLSLPVILIFIGISGYWRFLKFHLFAKPLFWVCFFLFFVLLYFILFFKKRKGVTGLIALLLLFSMGSNLKYFTDWAKNRKYKIVNTASVLNKVIPKSNIAGNWASLLSTGTPHKTHLLSGEMGVNWRKDFLKEHNVKYLLLTWGFFANELREYSRFFREELSGSKRIALFNMYRSEVHLISLDFEIKNENRIECEALRRNLGTVVYDPVASSKMALKFEPHRIKESIILNLERIPFEKNVYKFRVKGKGNFKGRVMVQQNDKTIKQGFIKFKSKDYQEKYIMNITLADNLKLILTISKTEGDIYLDYIDFIPNDR